MELKLAENIRSFRKERKLTQEQLAEVLGVTTGAVYKWESGLSIPEINLLVDMADFFDTSVDVLLGYRVRDNRLSAIAGRMCEYGRVLNPEALSEAEKLLKKYPNSFEAVYSAASAFLIFGLEKKDRGLLKRALSLFEQSRLLIDQNTDPAVSEQTLYGNMASVYLALEERDKAIELMKAHNANGTYNDSIGITLSIFDRRFEEAEPFLTGAFLRGVDLVFNSIAGLVFLSLSRNRPDDAKDMADAGIQLLKSIRKGESDFTEKIYAELLTLRAFAEFRSGQKEAALVSLQEAGAAARRFDADPDYGLEDIRFVTVSKETSVHDLLGATASESIGTLLRCLGDSNLSAMWGEISIDKT